MKDEPSVTETSSCTPVNNVFRLNDPRATFRRSNQRPVNLDGGCGRPSAGSIVLSLGPPSSLMTPLSLWYRTGTHQRWPPEPLPEDAEDGRHDE